MGANLTVLVRWGFWRGYRRDQPQGFPDDPVRLCPTQALLRADPQLARRDDRHCNGSGRVLQACAREVHSGAGADRCTCWCRSDGVGHHQSRSCGGATSRGSVNMSPGSDFGSRTASTSVWAVGRMTMSVPWRKICTLRSAIWKSVGRQTACGLLDLKTMVQRIAVPLSSAHTASVYDFASLEGME